MQYIIKKLCAIVTGKYPTVYYRHQIAEIKTTDDIFLQR